MATSIRNKLVSTRLVTQLRNLGLNWSNNSRRHLETLAFEEVRGSATIDKPYDSTVFILHGLLGSGRNWRSFARNLSSFLSDHSSNEWRLVLVDLRNHGNSARLQGLHPPNDLHNAAADLADLVKSQGWNWPDVVMGHSLGGKVALQYAQSCATGDYGDSVALPKQLWVLDSVPGVVNPEESSGEVERVLETLQSIPSPIPSRKWLVEHMMELGFSKSLSEWLGTNLRKSNDHETWTFNIEGAVQMFNSYRENDYWPLLEHPPNGTEISIVQAEKSDRWDPHVIHRLEALSRKEDGSEGKFSLHVLPKAGHWVHVDNPKGLLEIVGPRIASLNCRPGLDGESSYDDGDDVDIDEEGKVKLPYLWNTELPLFHGRHDEDGDDDGALDDEHDEAFSRLLLDYGFLQLWESMNLTPICRYLSIPNPIKQTGSTLKSRIFMECAE